MAVFKIRDAVTGLWKAIPVQSYGGSTWNTIQNKPFSTIGEGLTVESDVLKATGGTTYTAGEYIDITDGVIKAVGVAADNHNHLTTHYTKDETDAKLNDKQDTLVSGTNIKTINGTSVLGSGDIVISGSGGADWNATSGQAGFIANKPFDVTTQAPVALFTDETFTYWTDSGAFQKDDFEEDLLSSSDVGRSVTVTTSNVTMTGTVQEDVGTYYVAYNYDTSLITPTAYPAFLLFSQPGDNHGEVFIALEGTHSQGDTIQVSGSIPRDTITKLSAKKLNIGTGLSTSGDTLIATGLTTLPIASSTTLGGVIVGDGLSVETDGTISVSSSTPTTKVDLIDIYDETGTYYFVLALSEYNGIYNAYLEYEGDNNVPQGTTIYFHQSLTSSLSNVPLCSEESINNVLMVYEAVLHQTSGSGSNARKATFNDFCITVGHTSAEITNGEIIATTEMQAGDGWYFPPFSRMRELI